MITCLRRYFTFGVLADFFTLGAVTYSTFQFSTNTKEFMEAVQEVSCLPCQLPHLHCAHLYQSHCYRQSLPIETSLTMPPELLRRTRFGCSAR